MKGWLENDAIGDDRRPVGEIAVSDIRLTLQTDAGCHGKQLLQSEALRGLCDLLLLQRCRSGGGDRVYNRAGGGDFNYFGHQTRCHCAVDPGGESNVERNVAPYDHAESFCLELYAVDARCGEFNKFVVSLGVRHRGQFRHLQRRTGYGDFGVRDDSTGGIDNHSNDACGLSLRQ